MASGLHQISINYVAEEDRLLFRFSTRDRKEYLLYLTRRFVLRGLWPAIRNILSADPDVRRMTDEANKKAMLSFRHRGMVDEAAFGGHYDGTGAERPLGDEPVVAIGLEAAAIDGGYALTFKFKDAGKVGLRFESALMHNFCKLLIDMVNFADWDATIGFDVVESGDLAAQPQVH